MRKLIAGIVAPVALVGLILALACAPVAGPTPIVAPAPVETLPRAQVLILSDITDDPAGKIEKYQPLADYLAAHLVDFGIKQGKVVVAPDLPTMIRYLKTGQVDLFFDSPYPALTVYQEAGARPLLRRWKTGVGEYHTIIAVHKDTGIADLTGLLGKIIAFDDRVSTSGYLLPKGHLTKLGYRLAEKTSTTSVVAANEIGYVFAGGEKNVLAWVLQGKTAAAVIQSSDYEEFAPDIKSQLVILERTSNVPRHIALARPGMGEALQARIVELLLGLDMTPEGQAILKKFERTKKFDALPLGPEATIKMFQELFEDK